MARDAPPSARATHFRGVRAFESAAPAGARAPCAVAGAMVLVRLATVPGVQVSMEAGALRVDPTPDVLANDTLCVWRWEDVRVLPHGGTLGGAGGEAAAAAVLYYGESEQRCWASVSLSGLAWHDVPLSHGDVIAIRGGGV